MNPYPIVPKYFYTVLFIKSHIYNIKGQAIIFRRKSLQSLMKLIDDFDETYLHSSYDHTYHDRRRVEGNVDFLVKYTDNLNDVIKLIDQNSYIIKFSWTPPEHYYPYPPHPVPPPPPFAPTPVPPPPPMPYSTLDNGSDGTSTTKYNNIQQMVDAAVEKAIAKIKNDHIKRVKVTNVDPVKRLVEVRQWCDVYGVYKSVQMYVDLNNYVNGVLNWKKGDDALLIDKKYLQRINDASSYKRVKVVGVEDNIVTVYEFIDDPDSKTGKTIIGEPIQVNLNYYCYGDKTGHDWHVNDDALLFDNKYLLKLDVEGNQTLPDEGGEEGNTDPEKIPSTAIFPERPDSPFPFIPSGECPDKNKPWNGWGTGG